MEIKIGKCTIRIGLPMGEDLPIEVNGDPETCKEMKDNDPNALKAWKALHDPDVPKIFSLNPT